MKTKAHKVLSLMLTLILLIAAVPTAMVSASTATTYKGVDYAPVYDYNFYMGHPDLKKAYGNNPTGAFNHFVKYGMKEGRQASPNFNVEIYKANYADLRNAFGNDLPSYYKHYVQFGIKEGRNAVTSLNGGGSSSSSSSSSSSTSSGSTSSSTSSSSSQSTSTSTTTSTSSSTSTSTSSSQAVTVEVAFDLNGMNLDLGYNALHTTTQTVGQKYVLPENPGDARGYKFVGWFTEKVNGKQVVSSTTVRNTCPHTLYAHWEQATSSVWKDEYDNKYGMKKYMFTNPGEYHCEYDTVKRCGYYVYTYTECNQKKTEFIVWGLTNERLVDPSNNGITVLSKIEVLASEGKGFKLKTNGPSPMMKVEIDQLSPDLIIWTDYRKSCLQNQSKAKVRKALTIDLIKAAASKNAKGVITAVLNAAKTETTVSTDEDYFSSVWDAAGDLCRGVSISLSSDQYLGKTDDKILCRVFARWPSDSAVPANIFQKTPDSHRSMTINYSFVVYSTTSCKNVLTINRRLSIGYRLANGVMTNEANWLYDGFGVISD